MTDPVTQIAETIPPQAVNAVQSVLNAKPFALDDILNKQGMGEISIPNVDDAYNARQSSSTTELVRVRPAASPAVLDRREEFEIPPPEKPIPRATAPHERRSSSEDENNFIMATPLSSVASPSPGLGNIAAQSRIRMIIRQERRIVFGRAAR